MMNYKISFLEKRLLVTIDEKLIIREVKKALKTARRIDQEPKLEISTSLIGFGGTWISPYNFKVFSMGPTIIVWLRSVSIQFFFIIRKILRRDKRPYHEILEERYNFIVGHEIGHAYDIKSPAIWFIKYLGFILGGGFIGVLLAGQLQILLFGKHFLLTNIFCFLITSFVAYKYSPGERKATSYAKTIFNIKPFRVRPLEETK